MILAELHGYRFACRIDSGADAVAISDAIVKYLGDKGFFLPTMLPTNGKHFKAVDGHGIQSQGKVQISPKLSNVANPCRLRLTSCRATRLSLWTAPPVPAKSSWVIRSSFTAASASPTSSPKTLTTYIPLTMGTCMAKMSLTRLATWCQAPHHGPAVQQGDLIRARLLRGSSKTLPSYC